MYCTIDDILKDIDKEEVTRLVDDENRGDEIDFGDPADVATQRVLEQISAADDEINGYLRGIYDLPFASAPERIKQISKDIAIYNLYKRRYRLELPETLVSIYNKRIDELKSIQKGIVKLDVASDEPPPATIQVNKTSDDRIFGKDFLEQMP